MTHLLPSLCFLQSVSPRDTKILWQSCGSWLPCWPLLPCCSQASKKRLLNWAVSSMFLLSRVCPPLPLSPLKSKLHKKPTTKKEVSPKRLKPLQKLRNILKFRKLVFQFYFLLLKYKNRQLTLIFASSAFPSSSCKLLFTTVSVITEVRVL